MNGADKVSSVSTILRWWGVVSAVNQWIGSVTIQVINVETIVLPDRIEGTSDDVYGVTTSNGFYPVMISQGLAIKYFQCVRVWYRE
jgi:hypothetical protein